MSDDPTFIYRVAFGLTVFATLGVRDLLKNPQNPSRLKEYLFLFSVTAAVMSYGLAHDLLTFSISPSYFSAVKGLPRGRFFPDVAVLALEASWTAGLCIGLVLLVANNPSHDRAQLPYSRLARQLRYPLVLSPLTSLAGAALSRLAPIWCNETLGVAARTTEHIDAVTTVWAMHIGTYAGAALGLVAAAFAIHHERRGSGAKPAHPISAG